MKVFVALTCLLAVTSASLIASPHSVLLQPQHLPIIDHNGVPVEPLVNQATRVQHAQLQAAAVIRNGDLLGSPLALTTAHGLAAPSALALAGHGGILANAYASNGGLAILGRKRRSLIAGAWNAPLAGAWNGQLAGAWNGPLAGAWNAPLATSWTTQQHLPIASAVTVAAPAHLGLAAHGGILAAPLLDANSVPVEPLENQIVRAQNAAAHVTANIRTGDLHGVLGRKKRSLLGAWAPQHLPIIDANGVPVEPWANQASRIQHAQLRAAAQIRNGDIGLWGSPALALAAPAQLAHAGVPAWGAISHAGRIPLDTPDLVAVRAAHLATKVGRSWW